MRRMTAAFLLMTALAPAALAEAPALYGNARFGYTIVYPADSFVAEPESDNGDGRKFHARHGGASFLVWGSNNAQGQTAAEIADDVAGNCAPRPMPYRLVRPTVVVVSCATADGILYHKTLIRGGVLTAFEMTYPASERATWDKVVGTIAGSLRPGRGD